MVPIGMAGHIFFPQPKAKDKPMAKKQRTFKATAPHHSVHMHDDWTHNRDVYVDTDDTDAFNAMLDAIEVGDEGDGEN